MELLHSPAEKPLLEEAIEVLHQQSINWLNHIAFWKDENAFFNDLLSNKLFQNVDPKNKSVIIDTLQKVSGGDLEVLNKDVYMHERLLSSVLRENSTEQGDYREAHKKLLMRFNEMEARIKTVKKAVFELVKIVNNNFFHRNETLDTIYERRAVRKYTSKPVERLHIELLLKAAAMAPSAMNKQPCKFYVLTDNKRIKQFSKSIFASADRIYHKLLQNIVVTSDPIFHAAPVVIFITTPRDDLWGPIDTGMCAQNLMLAARAMGFDTCPVGLARFIEDTSEFKEIGIRESEKVQLAIVLGYADERPEASPRKNDSVTFV